MSINHVGELDLNLLKIFYFVFTERSVSRAADRLGLTQSAVSHGLRKLRVTFGDALFIREGMSIAPTIRARSMFDPVHRIMQTLQLEVIAETTFNATAARREFNLAMGDMAEIVFLPPFMRFMRANAPYCTVLSRRVANNDIVEALERGTAEIAIGNVPNADAHLYSQTMFLHDYMVIARRKHPRMRSKLTWDAYQHEEHIVVVSGSDVHLQNTVLLPRSIHRKVALTVFGFLSIPWIISGTDLIATVPTRLGDEMTQMAMVEQLPLPEPATPYPLQLLWHPRHQNDPAHRWLRQSLFSLMNRYPDVG